MRRLFITVISICLFFTACKEKTKTENKEDNNKIITPHKDSTSVIRDKTQTVHRQDTFQTIVSHRDSILLQLTQDILTAIKDKDYLGMAKYIDLVSGVRFSPYAYVDTVDDVKLSKKKFTEQVKKTKQDKIVWGVIDPTEESINMTLSEYMQKFVYDVDFVKPEKRSVNKFIGAGNSLNNLKLVYRNCDFTESHFSGFEDKYEGMDWRSLRLVFKERTGKFFLIGIVHDQWTI